MSRARINRVNHPQLILRGLVVLLEIDLGIEVPTSLQVVEQIAAAFVEQVVIQGAFLVNRYIILEYRTTNPKALRSDVNDRSRLNTIGIVHGIGLRPVSPFGDGDLRQKPVLLLILLAQALQGLGNTIG